MRRHLKGRARAPQSAFWLQHCPPRCLASDEGPESAASVPTPRDELNSYAGKVEQSAGELVALKQQFGLHANDAPVQAEGE